MDKNKELQDSLFLKGVDEFNKQRFYDAHEFWEELWLSYKLADATFVQGLIQLSVSYFHYYNGNIKGARSMVTKCLTKFEPYDKVRGIDVEELKVSISRLQKYLLKINNTSYNIDSYIISLKVKHE